MDSPPVKPREKKEPWHCVNAYKLPADKICPACEARRREGWRETKRAERRFDERAASVNEQSSAPSPSEPEAL